MKPVGLAIQINAFPLRRLKARSVKKEATALQYIFKYTTKVGGGDSKYKRNITN